STRPARRRSVSARSGSSSTWTANASEEQLEKLLSLTERYCVVYQTLTRLPSASITPRSNGHGRRLGVHGSARLLALATVPSRERCAHHPAPRNQRPEAGRA